MEIQYCSECGDEIEDLMLGVYGVLGDDTLEDELACIECIEKEDDSQ